MNCIKELKFLRPAQASLDSIEQSLKLGRNLHDSHLTIAQVNYIAISL